MTWFLDREFLEKLDLTAYDPASIARHTRVSEEVAAAFVSTERLYTVESCKYYGFWAGCLDDGRSSLLFLDPTVLHAVYFNEMGQAVGGKGVELTQAFGDEIPEDIKHQPELLELAQHVFGFHEETARIRAFIHPHISLCAIVPFPWHFHEVVLGLNEDVDEDDIELARSWIQDGNFVLHWGNAYYMSAEGDVESS
jgi:hypothetical protein